MQGTSPRPASPPAAAPAQLTRQELQLQKVLRFFTFLFAGLAASYVVQGIVSKAEFPFVANSLAKDGFFAALCGVAVADLRRFSWAVVLVIAGHVLLVVGLVTMAVAGDTSSVAGTFSGPDIPPKALLWGWVGVATAVVALLGFL